MGNNFRKMVTLEEPQSSQELNRFEPVESFTFHESFLIEDSHNGLYFNDVYMPEEIVSIILSYIPPKKILNTTLVCKKWCNIIKSDAFWSEIYSREYNRRPKKLPWYVYYSYITSDYFDKNLIKNGNGQNQFDHWKIVMNYGDGFRIEDPPQSSDPLPSDVPEFNGKTSCFATSYYECNKFQEISFRRNRLLQLIFMKYRPHIYVSEWMAARFDCGCSYNLFCKLYGRDEPVKGRVKVIQDDSSDDEIEVQEPMHVEGREMRIEQWAGSTWQKVSLRCEHKI